MTNATEERHLVNIQGINRAVILSALFAVADAAPDAVGVRRSDLLSLSEAGEVVLQEGIEIYVDQLHGRALRLVFDGTNVLDATEYDALNADGAQLVQTIVTRIRTENPFIVAGLPKTPDAPEILAGWARESLEAVSTGRAWRLGMLDRLPAPAALRGYEHEFEWVRDAWAVADEQIRFLGLQPRVAFDRAVGAFFGAHEYSLSAEYLAVVLGDAREKVQKILGNAASDSWREVDLWKLIPDFLQQSLLRSAERDAQDPLGPAFA